MNFLNDLYQFGMARRLSGHLAEQPVRGYVDLDSAKKPELTLERGYAMLPHAVRRSGTKAFEHPNLLFDSETKVLSTDLAGDYFWDLAESTVMAAGDSEAAAAVKRARKQLRSGLADEFTKRIAREKGAAGNLVLRMVGEGFPIAHRPAVRKHLKKAYTASLKPNPNDPRVCMVTGKPSSIPSKYGFFSNMPGADSTGCGLLTWNDATTPYFDREGSDNFPVGTGTYHVIQCAGNYASFEVLPNVQRCLAAFGKVGTRGTDLTDGVLWICPEDDLAFLRVLLHRSFLFFIELQSDDPKQRAKFIRAKLASAWSEVRRSTSSPASVALYGVRGQNTRLGVTDHARTTVGALCRNLLDFASPFEEPHQVSVGDAIFGFRERRRKEGDRATTEIGGRDMVQLAFSVLAGRPLRASLRDRLPGFFTRANVPLQHFDVQKAWVEMTHRQETT